MPDICSNRETGNALTLCWREIVAAPILVGSDFFQSDQKGVDFCDRNPAEH